MHSGSKLYKMDKIDKINKNLFPKSMGASEQWNEHGRVCELSKECRASEWVNSRNEASCREHANEWAVQANEQADKQMAQ